MALIPAERLTTWTPGTHTGVTGGIEQYLPGGASERTTLLDVTQAPYNVDNTGVSDASPGIDDAIADAIAANDGTVVYLPAGEYRCVSGFAGSLSCKNFTIRGAGPTLTTIVYDNPSDAGRCFVFGNGSAFNFPASDNTVLTGNTKDSDTITIADASPFSVGMIIRIEWENMDDDTEIEAGKVPILSTYGHSWVRNQSCRVTAVNTTTDTIEFTPPIIHDPDGLTARVFLSTFPVSGIGIESMTVDGVDTNPFSLIEFQDAHDCWVYNVSVKKANNYNIYFAACLNMEVRYSTVSERTAGGSNGAGLLANNCSAILVEDNIFFDLSPCIEWNFCTSGSVFAYNFVDGIANINHGPHNSFNLYEGNICTFLQSDGYFGGSSECTVYRNWLNGVLQDDTQYPIISLNRFSRDYSMVGNIFGNTGWNFGDDPYTFGYPNLGNSSYTGEAQPTLGDFWDDWKATGTLTTRTNDTTGTLTLDAPSSINTGRFRSFIRWSGGGPLELLTVVASSATVATFTVVGVLPAQGTVVDFAPGPEGYQELDLDCEASSILKGNRIISTTANEMIPGESLGGDTLIDSYFRDAKPTWFRSLDWPPVIPTDDTTANFESNPAGYRYINGDDPPAEGGTTISVANVTNFNVV